MSGSEARSFSNSEIQVFGSRSEMSKADDIFGLICLAHVMNEVVSDGNTRTPQCNVWHEEARDRRPRRGHIQTKYFQCNLAAW